MKRIEITETFISPTDTIRQAISCIDNNARGIALVVDDERKLIGTITDGDIRRAILAEKNLDESVQSLLDQKVSTAYPKPFTAPVGTTLSELRQLMLDHYVRQAPLVEPDGKVVDLVTLEELLPEQPLPIQAVIMAGGLGSRLRPLTESLPKPLLPVGGRPLMALMIEQLRQAGIHQFNVATHYLSEKIVDYFGDGEAWGVNINYLNEDKPLGTAGALGLIHEPDQPLLVINGDILTRLDFREMLNFHTKYSADLTVGVRQYSFQVPYGVIECDGMNVKGVQEKPAFNFLVNAGIYLLEPSVIEYIPSDQRFDMTDLIQKLIAEKRSVISFPIMEYWLDIGQHTDFEQAQRDVQDGRLLR